MGAVGTLTLAWHVCRGYREHDLAWDGQGAPKVVQDDALAEVEAQSELPLLPLDQVARQLHGSAKQ